MGKRINTGKRPDCVFWPDERPAQGTDKTGYRHGRLTIVHPVYIRRRKEGSGRVWLWLAVCDCGNEVIYQNISQTQSCGCLQREQRAAAQAHKAELRRLGLQVPGRGGRGSHVTPKAKLDRLKHCTRDKGQCLCKHYSPCADARVFEEKEQSDRYAQLGGKCFELGDKDKNLSS